MSMRTQLLARDNQQTEVIFQGRTIGTTYLRPPKAYPSIRHLSASDFDHDYLLVRWSETEQDLCCAHSACTGACGAPALVIPREDSAYRARNSYGAVCNVFEWWPHSRATCAHDKWAGETLTVPEEHRANMLKFMWW